MLSIIMLVIKLIVIMLSVIMLSVIMLSIIMRGVIMLSIVMRGVIMLSVIIVNVIMLSVWRPLHSSVCVTNSVAKCYKTLFSEIYIFLHSFTTKPYICG